MCRQGGKRCLGKEGKLYTKSAASVRGTSKRRYSMQETSISAASVRGASKWGYSMQETSIALGLGAAPSMRLVKEKGKHHPGKTLATLSLFRLQPSMVLLLKIYAFLEL